MADSPILPRDGAWRDGSGKPMPVEFYRFFRDLIRYIAQIDGNTAELAAIEARLSELEAADNVTISGIGSVQVSGKSPDFILQLFGDQLIPPASSYYGTDAVGVKGFHAIPDSPSEMVPYFVQDGENYTVPANKQALWKLPITLGAGSSLTILGALEQVT